MARWLDRLEDHGTKAVREARKRRLRPKVQEVIVTVRQSDDSDPGEVAIGHYVVEDGQLLLTDENGLALEGAKAVALENPEAARSVAANLTQKRWRETRGGFNRRLDYRPLGIA